MWWTVLSFLVSHKWAHLSFNLRAHLDQEREAVNRPHHVLPLQHLRALVEEEVCLAEAVWKRVPGMCEPVFVVVWIAFRLTLTSLGNSLLDRARER